MSDHPTPAPTIPPLRIAHIIDASGADGRPGHAGHLGRGGIRGEDGRHRFLRRSHPDGASGAHGGGGTDGQGGEPAGAGGGLRLRIEGEPEALRLEGELRLGQDPSQKAGEGAPPLPAARFRETVDLQTPEGPGQLLLRVHGGNGGHGGAGGDGGRGGEGGRGLQGALGNNLFPAGDNGGDGGRGGRGGRGGDGGAGGDGGDGGAVTVRSTDPLLFALVETMVAGGAAGLGGRPGRGGRGGSGGAPGRGGGGALSSDDHPFGGRSGRDGKPGRPGEHGRDGRPGRGGIPGRHGSLLWQVVDERGRVLEQAARRYELSVESFRLRGERDDAVFEPGEAITIHDLVLHNPGGLTLPAGVMLAVAPSAGLEGTPGSAITLPSVPPGQRRRVPGPMKVRLVESEAPARGEPLRARFELRLHAFVHRRLQPAVGDPTAIDVQHAVEVAHTRTPSRVLGGAVTALRLGLRNISSARVGEEGEVELRLTLPVGLVPTGEVEGAQLAAHEPDPESQGAGAALSEDPVEPPQGQVTLPSGVSLPASGFGAGAEAPEHRLRLLLPAIAPGAQAEVVVGLRAATDVPAYAELPWAAELWLRRRSAEIRAGAVTVGPAYDRETPPVPVLLVGGRAMTRLEHLAWARIFETLRLPMATWDADLEPEAVEAWPARHAGGLLVLPTVPEGRVDVLPPEALLRHFRPGAEDPRPALRFAAGTRTGPRTEEMLADAGTLVWGADPEHVIAPLFAHAPGVEPDGAPVRRMGPRFALPIQHTPDHVLRELHALVARRRPARRWRVATVGDARREGPFAWFFGTARVTGLRLRGGHRLRIVPPDRAGPLGFAALDAPVGLPEPDEGRPFVAPRAFSAAFCAVVASLPVTLKVRALSAMIAMPPAWRLADPTAPLDAANDPGLDVPELVARLVAAELVWERQRPVHGRKAVHLADDPGDDPPSSQDATDELLLDAAAVGDADRAGLPRHEILRAEFLAHPERFVLGDGPRLLRAVLGRMGAQAPVFTLFYGSGVHARRSLRGRAIAKELESALEATEGAMGVRDREVGRAAKNLALAWRTATDWNWIAHPTEPDPSI